MALISVKVTPRARIEKAEQGADGIIHIWTRAAPEAGAATAEAARILAQFLGIPPSTVRLKSGGKSRRKIYEVLE